MTRRVLLFASLGLVGLLVLIQSLQHPAPPNVEADGYTSATLDFSDYGESLPALQVTTDDPSVVRSIARVVATGSPATDCRCRHLGIVAFTRPDGGKFGFAIMPAHSESDIQVATGSGRFSVDRTAFLSAVHSLGLPEKRWTGEEQ